MAQLSYRRHRFPPEIRAAHWNQRRRVGNRGPALGSAPWLEVCTTHRWRKLDSNHWYRVMQSRFRERLMLPPLDFPPPEKVGRNGRKTPTPPAELTVRIPLFRRSGSNCSTGWSSRSGAATARLDQCDSKSNRRVDRPAALRSIPI